jgi:hypothetical protein
VVPWLIVIKEGQPNAGWIRYYGLGAGVPFDPDKTEYEGPPFDPATEATVEIAHNPDPAYVFDTSTKRWDWATSRLRDATPEEFASAPYVPSVWRCPRCQQIVLAGGDECGYCRYRR